MSDEPVGAWAAPESGSAAAMPWQDRGDQARGASPSVLDTPPPPMPLRPLTVADILDGAFSALRSSPRKVMTIAAAFVVPTQLLIAFVQRNVSTVPLSDLFDSSAADETFDSTADDLGGFYGSLFTSWLLSSLVLLFVTAALARLIAAWYAGSDITAGVALRGALKRTPALLGAWFLVKLIELATLPTCGIALVFLFPMYWAVTPAVALEGIGPFNGLRRSWRLTRRRYWPTVGAVLLTGVVWYAMQVTLPLLPELLGSAVGSTYGWIVAGVGNAAAAMITVPVLAASSVLVYIDLRIRTEGLDLELDANRLL